jgi:hypothetical protein
MKKTLTFIGRDSWCRPVYKDENGRLWKDVDCRPKWWGPLCSCVGNDFEGQPESPMRSDIEITFIPARVTD